MTTAIHQRVAAYYGEKLRAAGPTFAGVDWKNESQQMLRFEQLLRIVESDGAFSLNDYGCGYGALYAGLRGKRSFSYAGFDICDEMIAQARAQYGEGPDHRFVTQASQLPRADYTVASGIFNVKGPESDVAWKRYLLGTLEDMARHSIKGFAFNVLTTHVDFRRDDLFYADPADLLDHCIKRFSRSVTLLHDYGLYEFTLLVRMEDRP